MSIDFPCSQCGKLLRVGDAAAGKQARCPSCGTAQRVPPNVVPAIETYPVAEPVERPPTGRKDKRAIPDADRANPYAAPLSAMPPGLNYEAIGYAGPQNGPPWERDGASLSSFWATIKLAYSAPQTLFRNMRREGGIVPPLWYAFAGITVGSLGNLCCLGGLQVLNLLASRPPGRIHGTPTSPSIMLLLFGFIAVLVIPSSALLIPFVLSGVFHLCLTWLGGARHPYETTYRVVCYSLGSAALLMLIPPCGQYVYPVFGLVLSGIGLANAHATTGMKAALAVLLPFMGCCSALGVLYITALILALAAGR